MTPERADGALSTRRRRGFWSNLAIGLMVAVAGAVVGAVASYGLRFLGM